MDLDGQCEPKKHSTNNHSSCAHKNVTCLNPYELIRKYRCEDCGEVMMCSCEQSFAECFLPHQLASGQDQESKTDVCVTAGFQPDICNVCRGLPEEAHPKAELRGHSSKVRRYYWREIFFDTTESFANWAASHGYQDVSSARKAHPDVYRKIERLNVKKWIKIHRTDPKYIYNEVSSEEVLRQCNVPVRKLIADYVDRPERGVGLLDAGIVRSPEQYVARFYQRMGWQVIVTESRPFHALFGVFMWLLFEDWRDRRRRMIAFGDRNAFEQQQESRLIWTFLPQDFGVRAYAKRRASEINEHLRDIENSDDLQWLFDYWTEPSEPFRQYLWAHSPQDVAKARMLVQILSSREIAKVLRYLVQDYWARYVGWPDLFVHRDGLFFLAEVKSSRDKLREDQKAWAIGNAECLGWPFEIVKLHRRPKQYRAGRKSGESRKIL